MKRIWFFCLLCLGLQSGFSQFSNPLYIPDTLNGDTFDLVMAPGKMAFKAGDSTDTYGINGDYLGPTLIIRDGQSVQMNVSNLLDDTSTMHWHGMHVAPEDDGGPHSMILPGETWSPTFVVDEEATTFWYHPHLHSKTAEQVYMGASGMIIVRDDHADTLGLPQTYGVDDFPLIMQDKSFNASNGLIFAAMADTMMINGTLGAYLEVPAQLVRFRLLNASNQRVYNLGFPPLLEVKQIGSDGGLLESPLNITRMLLAPGERAELVVDFTGLVSSTFRMTAFNTEMFGGISGGPGGPGGGPGNPLDGADFEVLELRVVAPTATAVLTLPPVLNTVIPWDEADADRVRVKVFDTLDTGFPFYINSTPFNMETVNDTVMMGDIEVWELYNRTNTAHPFHIHMVQFYVLEVNGGPPPAHLRGRKDVILSIPGDSMKFIAKFEHFADSVIPYMYHCHNLFHEDAGMMGQFLVWDELWTSFEETGLSGDSDFKIFPNPTEDRVTLSWDQGSKMSLERIKLRNVIGQEFECPVSSTGSHRLSLDLQGLQSGIYLVEIIPVSGIPKIFKVLKH